MKKHQFVIRSSDDGLTYSIEQVTLVECCFEEISEAEHWLNGQYAPSTFDLTILEEGAQ
jgi:hypothetical protein